MVHTYLLMDGHVFKKYIGVFTPARVFRLIFS